MNTTILPHDSSPLPNEQRRLSVFECIDEYHQCAAQKQLVSSEQELQTVRSHLWDTLSLNETLTDQLKLRHVELTAAQLEIQRLQQQVVQLQETKDLSMCTALNFLNQFNEECCAQLYARGDECFTHCTYLCCRLFHPSTSSPSRRRKRPAPYDKTINV